MTDIQFVYFDLGGVLFNWENGLKNLAHHVRKPYAQVLAIFKKYDDDVCRGKITPNHFWNYFRDELPVDIEMEDFLGWWADNFTPIPAMHALVKQVSSKYKVGILTNIWGGGAFEIYVKRGHVPNIPYETVVQSCELSLIKPEAKFFRHAQKKAGVPASKILFIDDYQKNLNKAKALGWQTVLFEENHLQESIKRIKKRLKID